MHRAEGAFQAWGAAAARRHPGASRPPGGAASGSAGEGGAGREDAARPARPCRASRDDWLEVCILFQAQWEVIEGV